TMSLIPNILFALRWPQRLLLRCWSLSESASMSHLSMGLDLLKQIQLLLPTSMTCVRGTWVLFSPALKDGSSVPMALSCRRAKQVSSSFEAHNLTHLRRGIFVCQSRPSKRGKIFGSIPAIE